MGVRLDHMKKVLVGVLTIAVYTTPMSAFCRMKNGLMVVDYLSIVNISHMIEGYHHGMHIQNI